MVQPFMSEVRDAGEWSFLFLGGRFSHAVLKRPGAGAGDYRVQWEFGGTADAMVPPGNLVADAEAVMAAMPGNPLYARGGGGGRGGGLGMVGAQLIRAALFFGWGAGAGAQRRGW